VPRAKVRDHEADHARLAGTFEIGTGIGIDHGKSSRQSPRETEVGCRREREDRRA